MIRFYDRKLLKEDDIDSIVASEQVILDSTIWNNGKLWFKHNLRCHDDAVTQLLPLVNSKHEILCYAYQDDEANRELRMLRELAERLETNQKTLQFQDVFPGIHKVVVCGCNELAWRFVKYLENQQINVVVMGKYWDYLGYKNQEGSDIDGANQLVIYAEGSLPKTGDLYQTVIKSVSPEFECIDNIYEANVLAGNIKDTIGKFDEVLRKLRGKDIVILGTDEKAQDTYDLLYEHGIDISGFAEWTIRGGILLGKHIFDVKEAINANDKRIFIGHIENGSALGTQDVEFFDYYGYKRNEQFFLLCDYTEIPCTNLVHILKDKRVQLVGDERLSIILSDYLQEIEQGNIDVTYVQISQYDLIEKDAIVCMVYPWYTLMPRREENPKWWDCQDKLLTERISYTSYFSNIQAFVLIDAYMNKRIEKYSLDSLKPKGILLGRIQFTSGNIFFRGILDGHPDILKWDLTTALDDNLFIYCIRLANEKAENVMRVFKELYAEEASIWDGADFTDWDKFEYYANDLLSQKNRFTSQELFVIFFVAYTEMMRNEKITDIRNKIIYWEPHSFPREGFPFLAEWLESANVNGETIFMHRDNIVRMASYYKTFKRNPTSLKFVQDMFAEYMLEMKKTTCPNWEEFYVRFEDVKLHPKQELLKICNILGISWSDTMLRTTQNGEAWEFWGSLDFDLKPVFNKYEETLSGFDRFRISLLSSPYQKRYGYTYENCMKFSRRELQEMFIREFRFQQKLQFKQIKEQKAYYFKAYELVRLQLWRVRKHIILNDIIAEFDEVQIGERSIKNRIADWKEFINKHDALIVYGIGNDCEVIWENLSETEQSKCIFCDMRAEKEHLTFHGKKVVAPSTLCKEYKTYKILVTPSSYYKSIQYQLEKIGVASDLITCNKYSLCGGKK